MLTADIVKSELDSLIAQYPDNRGAVPIYMDEDIMSVYYMDANGNPVNDNYYDGENPVEILVTPICIVGHWVELFHPELKDYEPIKTILMENSPMISLWDDYDGNKTNLDIEVLKVLSRYQTAQDSLLTKIWSDIPAYMAGG